MKAEETEILRPAGLGPSQASVLCSGQGIRRTLSAALPWEELGLNSLQESDRRENTRGVRLHSPTMHPLDNVIWQALTTRQSRLAQGQNGARRFFKEVSVLAALSEPDGEAWDCLVSLLNVGERVGLFLSVTPAPMSGLKIVSATAILEMVDDNGESPAAAADGLEFIALGNSGVAEMLALTKLTKPGPFSSRTHEMGEYIGVRQDGSLAAMAGERLKIPGYTEISAVCTHPGYLGRGYATAMIVELMRRIRQRGEIPFLHVRPENQRAVGLYERLGFRTRVELQYTIVERR